MNTTEVMESRLMNMEKWSTNGEPTVKSLDPHCIDLLNTLLHGKTRKDYIYNGPSKMELWKKIAIELIFDEDVINTIEKMDITRSRDWLNHISSHKKNISICKLIEISEEVRRIDVKLMLEEIYKLHIYYLHEMGECQMENLAKMLEHDQNSIISASWKDYADKLHSPMSEIDSFEEWRQPMIQIVIRYLQKWKPNTTLSKIQMICRDELHHSGAMMIERFKNSIF